MSDLPPLRHPYRAVALLHAGLAVVILVFAGATGGDLTRALVFAAAYFAVATGWTWLRFRQRDRRAARGSQGSGQTGDKAPGRNGDS
ncbi:MAG TPA: hypothetical protein VJM07_06360 [Gaiella sp.]|nr:hypothetical protein [Gaiella sp.]